MKSFRRFVENENVEEEWRQFLKSQWQQVHDSKTAAEYWHKFSTEWHPQIRQLDQEWADNMWQKIGERIQKLFPQQQDGGDDAVDQLWNYLQGEYKKVTGEQQMVTFILMYFEKHKRNFEQMDPEAAKDFLDRMMSVSAKKYNIYFKSPRSVVDVPNNFLDAQNPSNEPSYSGEIKKWIRPLLVNGSGELLAPGKVEI